MYSSSIRQWQVPGGSRQRCMCMYVPSGLLGGVLQLHTSCGSLGHGPKA